MKSLYTTLAMAALFSASLAAQTCKTESIEATQPNGHFLDNKDGTVTDIVNGLLWSKCSFGQTYQDGNCVGTPTNISSWQAALKIADENSTQFNVDGWRLPNIKELGILVERMCVKPAINLYAFPSTPSAAYWSNTPDAHNLTSLSNVEGLIVDFSDGSEFLTDVNTHRLIRFVKALN